MRPVREEGPDGTFLLHCIKVYLPSPAGRLGMVFEVANSKGTLRVAYIAFGVRHHPSHSNALTVYQTAHRRLNDKLSS